MKKSTDNFKPELASNVTRKNYHDKAKLFANAMQVSTGSHEFGRTLNIRQHTTQWGAWRNYLKGKGVSVCFMDQRAKEDRMSRGGDEVGYQVPASMPSDFDSQRDYIYDSRSGDAFVAQLRAHEGREEEVPVERRKEQVRRIMSQAGATP